MQLLICLALAAQLGVSLSLRLPFRRDFNAGVVRSTSVAFKRADADPYSFNVVDFTGDNQIIYVANVTLDGQPYEVQLDTGSSDLWVNSQGNAFINVNDTGVAASIVYDDTTAAIGNIKVAPVQFGNFSVPSQAFIDAPGSNATSDNDKGVLGLGPYGISVIYSELANTTYNGLPLLNNIFDMQPSNSPYITFLLARSNLGVTDGGIFTIGEVDTNWAAIVNQSKVAIAQDFQQWIGLMDGVIVNGKNHTGHGLLSHKKINASLVSPAFLDPINKDKLFSVFDTGTALGYLPQPYFNAVYKHIKGIQTIDESLGIYSIPCNTKSNVSMVFNGTEYPINPLDLTRLYQVENTTLCINSFAPKDLTSQGIDVVLGDAFLRNVYMLMNYGNWTTVSNDAPYVQLLSTTNQSDAWSQFDELNVARMAQWQSLNGTFSQ